MNITEYLSTPESKYLVIGKQVWEGDPVAQGLSSEPRVFTINGVDYVILSLDPSMVPLLESYISSQGGDYEFGFLQGTGKVSFLLHSEALELLKDINTVAE